MTQSTPAAEAPGQAPRSIPLRTLLDLLPGNLQIMVFGYPPVAVGAAIWFAMSPSKNSWSTVFVASAVAPIYIAMILLFRRKLQNYLQAIATVDRIERGEGAFAGCKVLHYIYQVSGQTYEDDHLTTDSKGIQIGDPIWILVNPVKPSQSVVWLGKRAGGSA